MKFFFNNIGFVYLLYYPKEGLTKIGRSDYRPLGRYIDIFNSLPGIILPLGFFPVFNYKEVERKFLHKTRKYKREPRGAGPASGSNEFRNLPFGLGFIIYIQFVLRSLLLVLIDLTILLGMTLLIYDNNFVTNFNLLISKF